MKRSLIVLAVAAIVAAACSADSAPPTTGDVAPPSTTEEPPVTNPRLAFTTGELIALDLPRATPEATADDISRVVAGDAQLGLDILTTIAGSENVMISPYSIATALSMLYPGAGGETADQIAAVLHLDVDDATLHSVRTAIDDMLAEGEGRTDGSIEPLTVRPANSAWGQGGFPFEEDYLETLATHYGAGLRVADFMTDPPGATDAINNWVEEATEDRIEDLIPPEVITTDTRLVLVNAIWFKGNWIEQFDPEATSSGGFQLADESTVDVPLMHASITTGFAAGDGFEAVKLPYAGGAAMVIMLPSEGTTPAELAARLRPEDMRLNFAAHRVDITLPSFEFESDIALADALKALGMTAAFDSMAADLSGITSADRLYLQDALHKSFIALDEHGTEAAAATALVAGRTSAPPPAVFTADRPFLFWIEHSATGEPLFLGIVNDPR